MIFSTGSMEYIKRYLVWNYPGIKDYRKFPCKDILNDKSFFKFRIDKEIESVGLDLFRNIEYRYRNNTIKCTLDELLLSTGTTAFIIIKDDALLYEKYFNKYTRESINTSFSVAKSFTSALIGIAFDEGYIKSLDDRVIDYIPELNKKLSGSVTLRHLISMSSGIRYNPSYYPWGDEPKSYYYPDLRHLVLKSVMQNFNPGQYFKYSNYNTFLLGIILERTTKIPPNEYLQEKIWKPVQMEYSGTWSIDSEKNSFIKMDTGINARSIDFAKFGRLFLKEGKWENKQIISGKWVNESTCPLILKDEQYYIQKNFYPFSMFFNDKQLYYKYGWWGLRRDPEHYDYMAIGIFGQFIFVSPQKQLIIVRNGKEWGKINWWPALFKELEGRL
jgi:CubicO group peptidase (beta-lactamase class C family)